MSEEKFHLDREINIEHNVDALGKKWKIHFSRGSSLCYARPEPDRPDSVIPALMEGRWTKHSLLQERITEYLNESWDHAETKAAQAARTAQAAKELATQEAKEKKHDSRKPSKKGLLSS